MNKKHSKLLCYVQGKIQHINFRVVKKSVIAPLLGIAHYKTNTVYVVSGIPNCAGNHILRHEAYHISDRPDNSTMMRRIIGEIKATVYAILAEPKGFFVMLWLSVTSKARWSFYWNFYIMRRPEKVGTMGTLQAMKQKIGQRK